MDMVLKIFLMVIVILHTVILKNVKSFISVELWNLEHLLFYELHVCVKFGVLLTYSYHTAV